MTTSKSIIANISNIISLYRSQSITIVKGFAADIAVVIG